jgi:hypothetical protein
MRSVAVEAQELIEAHWRLSVEFVDDWLAER